VLKLLISHLSNILNSVDRQTHRMATNLEAISKSHDTNPEVFTIPHEPNES
jgi:hypothetical protein